MSLEDDDCDLGAGSSSAMLTAVVKWFRVYQVPFDHAVADVLCTVAIALHSNGFGERQIADFLIQNFNGPLATKATAPSSSAYH